jgi:S-DNA-T family DNA segregation ATPase FtsK/SpoIIIE
MGDAVLRLWQRGEGTAPVVEPVMRSRFAAGAELLDAGGEPAAPPEPARGEPPVDGSATYDASGACFPPLLAGASENSGAASLLALLRSPPLVEPEAPIDPDAAGDGDEPPSGDADAAAPPAPARDRADSPPADALPCPTPPVGEPALHADVMEDRHTRPAVMPEPERHARGSAAEIRGEVRPGATVRAAAASPASSAREARDVRPAAADLPGSPSSAAPDAVEVRPSARTRAGAAFNPSIARIPGVASEWPSPEAAHIPDVRSANSADDRRPVDELARVPAGAPVSPADPAAVHLRSDPGSHPASDGEEATDGHSPAHGQIVSEVEPASAAPAAIHPPAAGVAGPSSLSAASEVSRVQSVAERADTERMDGRAQAPSGDGRRLPDRADVREPDGGASAEDSVSAQRREDVRTAPAEPEVANVGRAPERSRPAVENPPRAGKDADMAPRLGALDAPGAEPLADAATSPAAGAVGVPAASPARSDREDAASDTAALPVTRRHDAAGPAGVAPADDGSRMPAAADAVAVVAAPAAPAVRAAVVGPHPGMPAAPGADCAAAGAEPNPAARRAEAGPVPGQEIVPAPHPPAVQAAAAADAHARTSLPANARRGGDGLAAAAPIRTTTRLAHAPDIAAAKARNADAPARPQAALHPQPVQPRADVPGAAASPADVPEVRASPARVPLPEAASPDGLSRIPGVPDSPIATQPTAAHADAVATPAGAGVIQRYAMPAVSASMPAAPAASTPAAPASSHAVPLVNAADAILAADAPPERRARAEGFTAGTPWRFVDPIAAPGHVLAAPDLVRAGARMGGASMKSEERAVEERAIPAAPRRSVAETATDPAPHSATRVETRIVAPADAAGRASAVPTAAVAARETAHVRTGESIQPHAHLAPHATTADIGRARATSPVTVADRVDSGAHAPRHPSTPEQRKAAPAGTDRAGIGPPAGSGAPEALDTAEHPQPGAAAAAFDRAAAAEAPRAARDSRSGRSTSAVRSAQEHPASASPELVAHGHRGGGASSAIRPATRGAESAGAVSQEHGSAAAPQRVVAPRPHPRSEAAASPVGPAVHARTADPDARPRSKAPAPVAPLASASPATAASPVSAARASVAPLASAATAEPPGSAAPASVTSPASAPPAPAAPSATPPAAGITPAERPDERASAASRRAAGERMPRVQVEIGRVEVMSPAPPARPRRARAGPLTPLDEYARRWGSGRR